MVGVVGSSPIAPTKYSRQIKDFAVTRGPFLLAVRKSTEKVRRFVADGIRSSLARAVNGSGRSGENRRLHLPRSRETASDADAALYGEAGNATFWWKRQDGRGGRAISDWRSPFLWSPVAVGGSRHVRKNRTSSGQDGLPPALDCAILRLLPELKQSVTARRTPADGHGSLRISTDAIRGSPTT